MDQILDVPIESQQRRIEYAGFWIRAAALIIDYIIVIVIYFIAITLLVASLHDAESDPTESILWIYGILILFQFLYFTLMESSEKQGTLGKLAVGIKIGDKNGNKISYANAVGRFFSKILSGMILYIGYMMAGWDDRKQALHDKIADTFVFYSR